jgi:hypothetical protein
MANSRYDNIRVYNGSSFVVPSQIKAWDGSSWVDYGTKDSYSSKIISAYTGSSYNNLTYLRHDVNIPKYIQIANNKIAYLRKANGSNLSVDTYNSGYSWEMQVAVYDNTPLYTAFTKNQGDIVNQSYVNYVAEVSGSSVRLRITTNFSGYRITDHKYVSSTLNKYTDYCFTVGEKVRIVITKGSTGGQANVKIYNPDSALLCDVNVYTNTQWVGTPNIHQLGSETTSRSGSQSSYGNAYIYYFSTTPDSSRTNFSLDIGSQQNGASDIWSNGSYSGYASFQNTSVYGESYTEYLRQ